MSDILKNEKKEKKGSRKKKYKIKKSVQSNKHKKRKTIITRKKKEKKKKQKMHLQTLNEDEKKRGKEKVCFDIVLLNLLRYLKAPNIIVRASAGFGNW